MMNGVEKRLSFLLAVALCGLIATACSDTSTQASSPAGNSADAAATASPSKDSVRVPAGTHLVVRMIDSINSKTNHVGETFSASLEEPLDVNGTLVAPRGTRVYGKLEQVKSAGKIKGQSELRLALTGIEINGATHSIVTGSYDVHGKSRGKNTAKKVGIGAAIGGAIGAIAGGGKGAAIRAGIGAGAGTAAQVLTHGQQINVPGSQRMILNQVRVLSLGVALSRDGDSQERSSPVHHSVVNLVFRPRRNRCAKPSLTGIARFAAAGVGWKDS